MAVYVVMLLLALNGWVAWRYSRQPIGPDEGHYLHWAVTGARPYRDFLDVKPPGVHLWTRLLGLLTGGSIPAIKGLHILLLGAGTSIGVYLYTGSVGAALMVTATINSAWMHAYQSWPDAMTGGFLLLALVSPDWHVPVYLGLALLTSLKAGPPGLAILLLRGLWWQLGACVLVAVLVTGGWYLLDRPGFRDMWYCVITLARRVTTFRRQFRATFKSWPTWFAAHLWIVVFTAGVALWYSRDVTLWAAAVAYAITNARGMVWRPCHSLPLAVIMAAALPPTPLAVLLLAMEWISVRAYLGNTWYITYPAIAEDVEWAKRVGESLQNAGTIWVNTYHTQIYAYARQPERYGMFQMLETSDVAHERVRERDVRLMRNPPRWIVRGPYAAPGAARGYKTVSVMGLFEVLG